MLHRLTHGLFLAALLSVAIGPSRLAAQFGKAKSKPKSAAPGTGVTPNCISCGGGYSVSVLPWDGFATAVAAIPETLTYGVTNTGGNADTYTLTCRTDGNETCGTVLPGSLTLGAGGTSPVTVTFTPGSAGTSGNVWLVATGSGGLSMVFPLQGDPGVANGGPHQPDYGSPEMTIAKDSGYFAVTNVAPSAPAVSVVNQNSDNQDRSLCLTVGAGESAAWNCGDLIVTHGMPTYSTMGRERSLTLVYNSNSANAHPVVAVDVAVPARMLTTPSVYMELHLGAAGTVVASGTWTGWNAVNYAVPQVHQLGLTFSDTTDATGLYPFVLIVKNEYPTGSYADTLTGNLILVNRNGSSFGSGWGVAGIGQLYFSQPVGASNNAILWLGGDGSAKVYAPAGTNKWVGAAGGYRDTIYYSAADTSYADTLRYKIVVQYNSAGRHVRTTSRTGQRTAFYWTSSRLDSISVPPGSGAGTVYHFTYDGNGFLDKITDPPGRVLDATVTNKRLVSLRDPDSTLVAFVYDNSGRMVGRTTRRGFTTRYAYASNGARLAIDSIRIDTAGGASAYAVGRLQAWDTLGVNYGTGGTGLGSVDTSLVRSKVDGPRTDVADVAAFAIDRWGAPTLIVDPLGYPTTIVRGNAAVPALPTKIIDPAGKVTSLNWDNLGNLTQLRDSTLQLGAAGLQTRVRRWTFNSDSTKFSPDSEIDSTETGALVTHFVYNRWGLVRDATAPNGHTTHFDYVNYAVGSSDSGLVTAVTELAVPSWDTTTKAKAPADLRRAFAFNSFGNVVSDTSPMKHVTRFTRDSLQRVTDIYDPRGHHLERVYDRMNRVTAVKQHVEQFDTGYTQPLVINYRYVIDVLDSIIDPRGVTHSFIYDAANRPVKKVDDYGRADVFYYDPAGLVDSVRTRMDTVGRNGVMRFTYYKTGRLQSQVLPAMAGYPFAGDTIRYTYDPVGRLASATSNTRYVARTYFGTGDIHTEVQSTASSTLATHLQYAYNRVAQRTFLINGIAGNAGLSDSIWYHYRSDNSLSSVGVRWRFDGRKDSVLIHEDTVGRRDSLSYNHGVVVHFAYDQDGVQRLICSTQVNAPAGDKAFNFTIYRNTADSDGLVHGVTYSNTGLPAGLSCSVPNQGPADDHIQYDSRHEITAETSTGLDDSLVYMYDGSGNRTGMKTLDRSLHTVIFNVKENMYAGHNQLRSTLDSLAPSDSEVYFYVANGGRASQIKWHNGIEQTHQLGNRLYAYDVAGRMTGTAELYCSADGLACQSVWADETLSCTYDPVGRLVSPCDGGAPNLSYDGQNVVRTGADSSLAAFTIVQGPGTDDPLMERSASVLFYFITDSKGRQYAAADTLGQQAYAYGQYSGGGGGRYAGGTTNANSYGAARDSTNAAQPLSVFRNRYYDSQTGRWTQEDPLGLLGGLNLYAYVGNNPESYIDPFGLESGDKCSTLKAAIRALGNSLYSRFLKFNTLAFENPEKPHHDVNINEEQRGLRKRIQQYRDECSDDDDDDFTQELERIESLLLTFVAQPKLVPVIATADALPTANATVGSGLTALQGVGIGLGVVAVGGMVATGASASAGGGGLGAVLIGALAL